MSPPDARTARPTRRAAPCPPCVPPVRPLLHLLMPPPVGCERHHHEDSTAHLHGPLAAPAPRPLHLQRGVVPRVCTKLHVHCLSARVRALLVAFPIEGTFQNYFNFKLPHTHSITPATWHNINPAGYRAVAPTQTRSFSSVPPYRVRCGATTAPRNRTARLLVR